MGMHLGSIALYGGGGYYLDLPNDKKKAISRLNELFENLWIDRGTSVIFIHVNIYNPNVNLFCIVSWASYFTRLLIFISVKYILFIFHRLVAELPPTGGILISSDFRTVKLLRYVRTQDYVILVFECLFLLFVIYYITEEVIEVGKIFQTLYLLIVFTALSFAIRSQISALSTSRSSGIFWISSSSSYLAFVLVSISTELLE